MIDMDGRAGAMMPSPSDAGSHHPASSVAHGSAARSARPKMLNDVYRLGEELGRGAFGQVFRALDTRTGQHVAVKQLSLEGFKDGDLQGIENEVELLASLRHRNVVKYLGCMRTRSHLHIILEYVENGSLASVIKPSRFGPFPEALVAVTIQQVLQGLAYLHARGVVHRDVKGANILTTKEGVVKLADFGVAAQLAGHEQGGADEQAKDAFPGAPASASQAPVYQTARESNHPVGSPYWMAPEVVEMKSVTPASDVWSVGCLAIELLTGAPPYYELQPMSALFNIVQDAHPPLPPGISAGMRDFLLGCFARDPALRPPARQLLDHPWVTY
ncbi:protein kinase, partial [Helicosporidium sp. ATCC 50920]